MLKLDDWKKLREKVETGELSVEDIDILHDVKIIDDGEKGLSETQMETGNNQTMERGHQKVLKLPGVPKMHEEENMWYEKAGFSNALLLAVISFVAEILFIGLTLFIYR